MYSPAELILICFAAILAIRTWIRDLHDRNYVRSLGSFHNGSVYL